MPQLFNQWEAQPEFTLSPLTPASSSCTPSWKGLIKHHTRAPVTEERRALGALQGRLSGIALRTVIHRHHDLCKARWYFLPRASRCTLIFSILFYPISIYLNAGRNSPNGFHNFLIVCDLQFENLCSCGGGIRVAFGREMNC